MRRIVSISLLFLFLAPLPGLYLWLSYEKNRVRKEVKEAIISGMDKDRLVKLTFTLEQTSTLLDWEHEKEFEYNGMMYDIVETIEEGNIIHYWCWPDREETELNRQISELVSGAMQHDRQKQDRQQRILQFMKTIHFSPAGIDTPLLAFSYAENNITPDPSPIRRSSSPPSPPPKTV